MRIGIDIDDTITDLQDDLLDAALKYDKTLRNKGVIYPERHYIAQRFDWNEEEKEHYLGDIRWEVLNRAKLREGVIETITKLKEEGHEIIFITARGDKYNKDPHKETMAWLQKHNIPFDKLVVKALDKGINAKNENIDIFIDDQEKNCLLVKNSGIKTILFKINEKPTTEDFIIAYSWRDILNKINELK